MKELTLQEVQKLLGYEVKIVAEKPAEIGGVIDVADDEKLSKKKLDECTTSYKAHVAFGNCEGIVMNLDERIEKILNDNNTK